jgi:hypothetical protein
MPTAITIKDEGIRIEPDGTFRMDLTKFKDMNSEVDILSIINSTVAAASIGRHAHEINSLTLAANDSTSKIYLPSKVTLRSWLQSCLGQNYSTQNGLGAFMSKIVNGLASGDAIVANLRQPTEIDASGSRTEYAGDDFTGNMVSTYVYTDPVE